MNDLWLSSLVSALIGSFGAIFTELIISWFKKFSKYPKLKVYSKLKKDNVQNFYFKYYSNFYNKDLLIVRLNVVNLSAICGNLFDIKLYHKDKYRYFETIFTPPLSLPFIQKDEVLTAFLKSEKFSKDIFFENDIKVEGREHKAIYMVFDASEHISYFSNDKLTLFYNYNTEKLETKKIKIKVPPECVTYHYKLSEIDRLKMEHRTKEKKIKSV